MARVIGALLLLVLVGCTPQIKEVVVEKTVTRYATMEDAWLADCPVLPPPTMDPKYRSASLQGRIDLWSTFYVQYAKVGGGCNVVLKNAREYNQLKRSESTTLTCKEGVCH